MFLFGIFTSDKPGMFPNDNPVFMRWLPLPLCLFLAFMTAVFASVLTIPQDVQDYSAYNDSGELIRELESRLSVAGSKPWLLIAGGFVLHGVAQVCLLWFPLKRRLLHLAVYSLLFAGIVLGLQAFFKRKYVRRNIRQFYESSGAVAAQPKNCFYLNVSA